jgi:hypothetical protein
MTKTLSRTWITATAVLLVFVLSVLVRLPFINRPLSEHHETITAHMLVTLRIWYENSIFSYHFSPVYTTPHDQWAECLRGSICDASGNIYYVSYPPFAFYAPYLIFSILSIYPSVLPLQVFNLIVHFLCALFVYGTVLLIRRKRLSLLFDLPAFCAYFIYLFTPETLWFQGNTYFSEIFVQLFFTTALFLSAYVLTHDVVPRRVVGALGVVIFLFCFTEWLGFFFVGIFAVYCLTHFRDPSRRALLFTSVVAAVSALVLTVFIYSSVNGFSSYMGLFTSKFENRSGLISSELSDGGIVLSRTTLHDYVWGHYKRGYGVLLSIVPLYLFILFYQKGVTRSYFSREVYWVLIFALLPVLLHHLLFFNFTAIHDFSVLKAAPFIALLLGILIAETFSLSHFSAYARVVVAGVLLFFIYDFSVSAYTQDNTLDPDTLVRWQRMGEVVAHQTAADELVFLQNGYFDLRFFYYTRRTVIPVSSLEEARSKLESSSYSKAAVFSVDSNYTITNAVHIQK